MPFTDFSTKIFPSKIKIGDENAPNHPLHIVGEGSGTTTSSLRLDNSAGNRMLEFFDDRTLFIGDGSSPNLSWKQHIQTTDGINNPNSGLPHGILVESTSDNLETQVRSGQFNLIDNANNSEVINSAFNGAVNYRVNINNSEVFEFIANGSTVFYELSPKYQFYTNGGSSEFFSGVSGVARPLNIKSDQIDSEPIPSDSGTTTVNSAELRLFGRYWNGSDNRLPSSIQHILDDNSPTHRLAMGVSGVEETMNLTDSGRVSIGNISATSKVHIYGDGNDSSTKSLQIEDSDGLPQLRQFDNQLTVIGNPDNPTSPNARFSNTSDYTLHTEGYALFRDDDNNRQTAIQGSIIRLEDNDQTHNLDIINDDGSIQMFFRNDNDLDMDLKFNVNNYAVQWQDSQSYEFYVNNSSGSFANGSIGRALAIRQDLLETRVREASTGETKVDSVQLYFYNNYWDGSSNQTRSSYIRHFVDDTSPITRLGFNVEGAGDFFNIRSNSKVGIGTTTPNSTLDVVGSTGAEIQTVTSDYTATTSDHTILGDASSGNLPIALPAPSDVQRIKYNIKKIDSSSNNVDITVVDGSNIDGDTTQSITGQYDAITLHCDGTQYWIL